MKIPEHPVRGDRLTQLDAIMAESDPITEGYKGQPVPHPLLNEIRQTHQLIAQPLGRLDLDGDDGGTSFGITVSSPNKRSVKARKAANTRWSK